MFIADDDHFKTFAATLERTIAGHGDLGNFFAHQRKQLNDLIALENKFRKTLISSSFGKAIYRKFIAFICDTQKNILDARPFFRERQDIFAEYISAALKERSEKQLARFAINYQFILFVMKQRRFGPGSPLRKLATEIGLLRTALVELNMPLAINRARIFFSRTPKSHLSRMDLVQIACEGLMSGIDKYSPDKNGVIPKVFRSTAMGRMGGNFIESYSQTLIHFFPVDKRKLYRGNKALSKLPFGAEPEVLAKLVNENVDPNHQTNPAEIQDLMAAASTVSADSSLPTDPEAPEPIERFAAPESTRPDKQMEERETNELMIQAYQCLTVFERKLLRLKGVRF